MNKYEQFYINGEWVNPVNKLKTLDVINPATEDVIGTIAMGCLLYTSPSPRDQEASRMPSSA